MKELLLGIILAIVFVPIEVTAQPQVVEWDGNDRWW